MATNKHPAKKKRLIKAGKQTSFAPFWTVLKIYGARKVHPSRHTTVKRSWRRSTLKK